MSFAKDLNTKTYRLYKPKEENVKKLEAFLKNIEDSSENKRTQ